MKVLPILNQTYNGLKFELYNLIMGEVWQGKREYVTHLMTQVFIHVMGFKEILLE